MNRYLTQGIFHDLLEGKRVLIAAEQIGKAETLFRAVVAEVGEIGPWDRVSYVNGAQGAWLGVASVHVYSLNYLLSRAPSADVVVLFTGMSNMDSDRQDDLIAYCALADAELIATD